jgi:hypothetical protein
VPAGQQVHPPAVAELQREQVVCPNSSAMPRSSRQCSRTQSMRVETTWSVSLQSQTPPVTP